MPRTSLPAVWLGLPVIVALFLVMVVAAGGALAACVWFLSAAPEPPNVLVEPSATASENTDPVATLSAAELWDAFGKNAVDADAKYKGKWVKVTGNVAAVENNGGATTVGLQVASGTALNVEELNLRPEREQRWHKEGFPPNVVCFAAPGSERRLASLKRGDRVEVVGMVAGRKKADVWHDYIVLLEGCRLVGPGNE